MELTIQVMKCPGMILIISCKNFTTGWHLMVQGILLKEFLSTTTEVDRFFLEFLLDATALVRAGFEDLQATFFRFTLLILLCLLRVIVFFVWAVLTVLTCCFLPFDCLVPAYEALRPRKMKRSRREKVEKRMPGLFNLVIIIYGHFLLLACSIAGKTN